MHAARFIRMRAPIISYKYSTFIRCVSYFLRKCRIILARTQHPTRTHCVCGHSASKLKISLSIWNTWARNVFHSVSRKPNSQIWMTEIGGEIPPTEELNHGSRIPDAVKTKGKMKFEDEFGWNISLNAERREFANLFMRRPMKLVWQTAAHSTDIFIYIVKNLCSRRLEQRIRCNIYGNLVCWVYDLHLCGVTWRSLRRKLNRIWMRCFV